MSTRVAILVLIIACVALASDVAHIGHYMYPAPDNRNYFAPGASTSTDWNHELGGKFPTHGSVNYYFWKDTETNALGNCLRMIGGRIRAIDRGIKKVSASGTVRLGFPVQYVRFADQYLCFHGIDQYFGDVGYDIPFSVFVNNKHALDTDTLITSRPRADLSSVLYRPTIQPKSLNPGAVNATSNFIDNVIPYVEMMWPRVPRINSFCEKESIFCLRSGGSIDQPSKPDLPTYLEYCKTFVIKDSDSIPVDLAQVSDLSTADYTMEIDCMTEGTEWRGTSFLGDGVTYLQGAGIDQPNTASPPGMDGNCGTDADCFFLQSVYLNVPFKCALDSNRASVTCIDPSRPDDFLLVRNRKNFDTAIDDPQFVIKPHDIMPLISDSIPYQSWESSTVNLKELFNAINFMPDVVMGLARRTRIVPNTSKTAGIWSLPWTHVTNAPPGGTRAGIIYNGPSDVVNDPAIKDTWIDYASSLGRVDPSNVFFMQCPTPTHNNPGVKNGSQCNAQTSNLNFCQHSVGRCFCDKDWLGIACDIPYPKDGSGTRFTYAQLVADASDPYEICSTAGSLMDTATVNLPTGFNTEVTHANVPICRCMDGFYGWPTVALLNSSVEIYASLFHQGLVGAFINNRFQNSLYFDFSKWYGHNTGADFDAAHNLQTVDDESPTSPPRPLRGIKYDWFSLVANHQCLIYTGPKTRPPQNLWWDYHSAPFIAAVMGGGLSTFSYQTSPYWFPWPAISTNRRNATQLGRNNTAADGRQGIRCMDYKEYDWATLIDPSVGGTARSNVAKYLQWLQTKPEFWPTTVQSDGLPVVTKATLYGGRFCTPCPDCNRSTSVCTEGPPVSYTCDCNPSIETCSVTQTSETQCVPITLPKCHYCDPVCPSGCTIKTLPPFGIKGCVKTVTTYHKTCTDPGPNVCKCDENFCGPTCNIPVCPLFGTKICGNGTCTINPATNCENLQPGQYGGTCQCNPGYEGIDCSIPTCPYFSSRDGTLCGNGTCNAATKTCECNPGWTGDACDVPACPFDPNNNLECSGATRADNGGSVCNRATQKCECFRTIALNLGTSVSGWPSTDLTPFVNGRYGVACEKNFGRACRDPQDGSWCGQRILANGNFDGALDPSYAGCYNETCSRLGLGGEECTPYCHCTLEYAVPQNTYCRKSVCGPELCGFPKGKCNPTCKKNGAVQRSETCTTAAVLGGNLTLTPHCDCQSVNGTFYYHQSDDPDGTAPCTDAAPICTTPATNPNPCNNHGSCAYNLTSGTHFCKCDAGFSGANCSIAPACTTPITNSPCVGPTRGCGFDLGHNNPAVCSCNSSYFRDPDRNCTLERCVTTGGTIDSDGECTCPDNTVLYSDPPLSNTELNHVALGCRKMCPISILDGVECGSKERSTNAIRCSDLYPVKDPIFGNDPRPKPTCVCGFLGHDHYGQLNYFINASDFNVSGMCEPKCNPEGLCQGSDCPTGVTVDPVAPFNCYCSPNYPGDRCYGTTKCDPTHSHHTGGGQCTCHTWCQGGPNCDVDLCAPSGGQCKAGYRDCDCTALSPVLKVDSSTGLTSNRNCTSACLNGGVLSSDKQRCICPSPFYGPLCEIRQGCSIQWSGIACNVSTCRNGGIPLPNGNGTGCTCIDTYYSGALCDQDLCTVGNRRNRTSLTTCACAWSLTGDSCEIDPCSPGGSLSLVTGQCQCNPGWTLAANRTACLLSAVSIDCDSDHGTIFNRTDGSQLCVCDTDYVGDDCSTHRCTANPDLLQGPYCQCPAGSYAPPTCTEDYCNSAATGYNITIGRCICPTGYSLSNEVDASGTLQCQPDPHYCSYLGTLNWNNNSNPLPCDCAPEWSGPTCSVFTPAATDDTSDGLSSHAMIAIAAAVFVVIMLSLAGYCIYSRLIRAPSEAEQMMRAAMTVPPQVAVTGSRHWRQTRAIHSNDNGTRDEDYNSDDEEAKNKKPPYSRISIHDD